MVSGVSVFLIDAGLWELPDPRLLAEVREFQPSNLPIDVTSQFFSFSSLKEKSGLATSLPSVTSAMREDLPSLNKKWVEKIQERVYVDFAELPPAKG